MLCPPPLLLPTLAPRATPLPCFFFSFCVCVCVCVLCCRQANHPVGRWRKVDAATRWRCASNTRGGGGKKNKMLFLVHGYTLSDAPSPLPHSMPCDGSGDVYAAADRGRYGGCARGRAVGDGPPPSVLPSVLAPRPALFPLLFVFFFLCLGLPLRANHPFGRWARWTLLLDAVGQATQGNTKKKKTKSAVSVAALCDDMPRHAQPMPCDGRGMRVASPTARWHGVVVGDCGARARWRSRRWSSAHGASPARMFLVCAFGLPSSQPSRRAMRKVDVGGSMSLAKQHRQTKKKCCCCGRAAGDMPSRAHSMPCGGSGDVYAATVRVRPVVDGA